MKKSKTSEILGAFFKHLNPVWGVKVSNSGRLWVDLSADPREIKGWRHTAKTPKSMLMDTVQYNILKRVWQSGEEGLRYTDIQMFIIGGEEQLIAGPSSLPHRYEKVWDNELQTWSRTKSHRVRISRGQYGTWLTNQLPLYAIKNSNGRWKLDHPVLKRHCESRFGSKIPNR